MRWKDDTTQMDLEDWSELAGTDSTEMADLDRYKRDTFGSTRQ